MVIFELPSAPTEPELRASTPALRVAVVVPILNEAHYLHDTLTGLLAQDYPPELMEILIIDGGSSDNWRATLPSQDRSDIRLRVLDNPGRTTAAAVNLAISATDADTILWISGHCLLDSDYIRKTASQFTQQPGQVVGGRLVIDGHGAIGRLNALMLTSRFGTGAAAHRFGAQVGLDDAVTYSLFDRRTLIAVGGLDERFTRNQDIDLIVRLKERGIQFRRVDSKATYLAPRTITGQLRRGFYNGAWNIWGQRLRRGGLSWWHFVPMAMVGVGTTLFAIGLLWLPALYLLSVLAIVYILTAIVAALSAALSNRQFRLFPVLPFYYLVHHVIYGLGSWVALLRTVPTPRAARDEHKRGRL